MTAPRAGNAPGTVGPRPTGPPASRAILGRALAALALLAVVACGGEPAERGVAARVNGRPIALKVLEFTQEIRVASPQWSPAEALGALKAEYGQALAGLVAEELVAQELARRGMEVTEAEALTAETALRAGYPGRAFEDMLAEEGIDPEIWRGRLKARLAMNAFTARVLRPRVSVTPEEVQAYYRENWREFSRPEVVRFIRVESVSQDALSRALAEAGKAAAPMDLLGVFEDVSMQEQASPEEALPRAWRDALAGLAPGQAGKPMKGGLGHQGFVLLERVPAKADGLVQAYPLVEKRLTEARLAREFEAWLAQAVNTSVIEISPGLVP